MSKGKLSAAASFFYDNAGYSYDPKTETAEQGHARCALGLESAEVFAREAGYSFEWDRSDIDSSDFSDDEPAWDLYDCVMRDAKGSPVQALCACDFGSDADGPFGNYRRVVEAELAAEEMLRTMRGA